jgi:hypothetical protein
MWVLPQFLRYEREAPFSVCMDSALPPIREKMFLFVPVRPSEGRASENQDGVLHQPACHPGENNLPGMASYTDRREVSKLLIRMLSLSQNQELHPARYH